MTIERDPLNQELDDLRQENAELRNTIEKLGERNRNQANELASIKIEVAEMKAKTADVLAVIRGELDPCDLETLAERRAQTRRRRLTDPGYCPHGSRLASCHDCAMEAEFINPDATRGGEIFGR